MAELVGVVASGVSIGTLAAQATSSLIKLKGYWNQVRDAPEDIQDLLEELEILSHVLAQIEDDQRENPLSTEVSGSTSECLLYCKQGVDRLEKITAGIQSDLKASSRFKRKWGSAKVLFKTHQVDKYKARLERAIRLLSLSHQIYTRYVETF